MKKIPFWKGFLSVFDESGFCLLLVLFSLFGIGFSSWVIDLDDLNKEGLATLDVQVADIYDLSLYFQNISVSTLEYTDGGFVEDSSTGTTKDLGNFQIDGRILGEDVQKNIGDFSIKLTMSYSSDNGISLFDFVDADESAHGKNAKIFRISEDGENWNEEFGVGQEEGGKIVMSYSPASLNQNLHFRLGFQYSDPFVEAFGTISNIEFYFSLVVK